MMCRLYLFPNAGGYLRQFEQAADLASLGVSATPGLLDAARATPSPVGHSGEGSSSHVSRPGNSDDVLPSQYTGIPASRGVGTDGIGEGRCGETRGGLCRASTHPAGKAAGEAAGSHSHTDASPTSLASAGRGGSSPAPATITPAEWFDFVAAEQIARADRLNAESENV